MLIMTLVPPMTAFFSFIIIGERLTLMHGLGMTLTFTESPWQYSEGAARGKNYH